MYLVYTPDEIVLVRGDYATCLNLLSSADLYLEAKVVGHAH